MMGLLSWHQYIPKALWALHTQASQGVTGSWPKALIMLGSIPVMVLANAMQMVMLLGAAKSENENLTNAQQIVTDSASRIANSQVRQCDQDIAVFHCHGQLAPPNRWVSLGFQKLFWWMLQFGILPVAEELVDFL